MPLRPWDTIQETKNAQWILCEHIYTAALHDVFPTFQNWRLVRNVVSKSEQCQKNAQAKSERKRRAAFEAISFLKQEGRSISKAAVAKRAGVSVAFLRSHPDLVQAIEDTEQRRLASPVPAVQDKGKDQVIAALRRRLDGQKAALAAKDGDIRQKQREIDRLYGKLAAASPLTDGELRQCLQDALARLARQPE